MNIKDVVLLNEIKETVELLLQGSYKVIEVPTDCTQELTELAELVNTLVINLQELYSYEIALANGVLDAPRPKRNNYLAAGLKNLNTKLMHLTWQAQQIEKGDYSQHVDFMGEFSKAFNSMVEKLDVRERELKQEIEERKNAEAALIYSNSLINTVLNNINAILIAVENKTGNVLFINNYVREIFELEKDEDLHKYFGEEYIGYIIEQNELNYFSNVEIHCKANGRWYNFTASQIEWMDKKDIYLLTGTDINERKLAQERLEYFAYTDPMTGVSNRRTGFMTFEKEIEFCRQNNKQLAICFIDIDGLKYVNDTYGHAEGDFLISTTASIIKSSIKYTDTVSRMGGDEFLVICSDSSVQDVQFMINKAQKAIDKLNRSNIKPYNLSFSYGIEQININNKIDINNIIKIADDKMYENKAAKKRA